MSYSRLSLTGVALFSAWVAGCTNTSTSGFEVDDGASDGPTAPMPPGGRGGNGGPIQGGGVDGRAEGGPTDAGPARIEAGLEGRAPDLAPGARPDAPRDLASGPVAAPQCASDGDCMLVNDCCNCMAIAKGEKAPYCDPKLACLIPSCMQYGGIEKARCVAGRCILGLDCDTSTVTCRRLAPVCPAGQVPRVVMMGGMRCYGECAEARQCLSVPSCVGCAKADLCVRYSPSPQPLHCVPPPPACDKSESCACLGPAVCTGTFNQCRSSAAPNPAITCECPNCL